MKKFFSLLFLSVLSFNLNAQSGCESNLSTSLISGPDSLHTDADQSFRSLTVNPYNENHIVLGTEGNGAFISRDGGQTWRWERNGFRHFSLAEYAENWGFAFDLSDTNVVFAATTNSPGPVSGNYPSAMSGVYKSVNGGANWVQKNCGLVNSKIASIWADSTIVVVSVSGEAASFQGAPQPYYIGGIYYSEDKGDNWVKATVDVNLDSVQCWKIIQRGNALYTIGVSNNTKLCTGFIKSTDKGKTWHSLANPLNKRMIPEFGISHDGKKIIAMVRDSFFVYITEDEGISWSKMNIPINGHVSIHPEAADTVFFSTWSNLKKTTVDMHTGDINSSDYHQVLTQNNFIEKMVFAPSNLNTIYVSTRGYRLYKSTDGGDHFVEMVHLRDVMRAANNSVSINEISTANFSLYPTLSNDGLFNSNVVLKAVKVIDALGQIVYSNNSINSNVVDLSSLCNGVYYLQNDNSTVQQIVISK